MRYRFCIPALFVAVVSCFPVAKASAGPMMMALQKDSPARLIETTHAGDDWLQAAKIENRSAKTVMAYKIGWVYVLPNKKRVYEQGPAMNVPVGINPGAIAEVPAQNVRPDLRSARTIFYVSDVKFSDGSHWHVDRKKITGF